ncbi:rRNA pseudouridine synthase [Pelagibius litoralis]|uniref:Pseudouridine synthase n=1 Tax=Pelagibius litoralis TaxID=374515 RepID=A0A967F195_9PROT|nr:pseudouridine synthase [Pelagibius litoralis]NIA71179.1 rRNA pseudouridine synthase [Pelagibius litoralis]
MIEIQKGERIAKVIARAGLCSRRDAEAWITAGRVSLDGKVLTSPATLVTAESRIEVDGALLPEAEAPRLWRYHKPRGELTTARDPQGRATVFDHLPADVPRLQAVGRLDINSEGLLLMTNDGGLKRQLELPANGWLRRYRVRAHGRVTAARLAALAKGVTVEGIDYGPVEAQLDRQSGANAWLTIGLREGKNREVRKICAHLGLAVNRLIRVSYGPFALAKLPNRSLEEVPSKRLREALGLEDREKRKTRGKGFARAKPKPNRPGSRHGLKKPEKTEGAGGGKPGIGKSGANKSARGTRGAARTEQPRSATKTGAKPAARSAAARTKPAAARSAASKSKTAKPATARGGTAKKGTAKPKPGFAKPTPKKPAPKKSTSMKPAGKKPAAKKDNRKSHANRRRPS